MIDVPAAALEAGALALSRYSHGNGIEDAVRHILERRRKCNASGQRGEDIELIRAALVRPGASLRSTAAEVA